MTTKPAGALLRRQCFLRHVQALSLQALEDNNRIGDSTSLFMKVPYDARQIA
jgi:hypothetical protein